MRGWEGILNHADSLSEVEAEQPLAFVGGRGLLGCSVSGITGSAGEVQQKVGGFIGVHVCGKCPLAFYAPMMTHNKNVIFDQSSKIYKTKIKKQCIWWVRTQDFEAGLPGFKS